MSISVYYYFWYLIFVGPQIQFLLLPFFIAFLWLSLYCATHAVLNNRDHPWSLRLDFYPLLSLRRNFGQSVVYFESILPALLGSTCCFQMTLVKLGCDEIPRCILHCVSPVAVRVELLISYLATLNTIFSVHVSAFFYSTF